MGGHSSREGLDNILLSKEVDILNGSSRQAILSYYRMVDDISIIFDGSFSSVMELLGNMAAGYPKEMPLNIQISFGYSRFLDCHINNYLQKSAVNKITTSLAYKELARFDYV